MLSEDKVNAKMVL